MKHPEGIEGLTGRPPYGAVVSMGRKGRGGHGVVEKDVFHIVSPYENEAKIRPYLNEFAPFHARDPERRRLLHGMMVYPRITQSITYRLSMRAFPKGYRGPHTRPQMQPVCEGNGVMAQRWIQDDEKPNELVTIRGCGDLCEFRQSDKPPCMPYAKLAFMLAWDKPGAPTPLCKLETKGWGSTRNIKGFIDYLEGIATESGITEPNWMGLRFSLQLVQKTNPKKNYKWHELVLSPEVDLVEFLRWQHERLVALRAPLPELAIPDLREQEDETVYADIQSVALGEKDP